MLSPLPRSAQHCVSSFREQSCYLLQRNSPAKAGPQDSGPLEGAPGAWWVQPPIIKSPPWFVSPGGNAGICMFIQVCVCI